MTCFFNLFVYNVFVNKSKKLVMLLMMELLFLFSLISINLASSFFSLALFLVFFLFSFMVIDSVFCLSLLISCSRLSSFVLFKSSLF